MTKKAKQIYSLTLEQLTRLVGQGTYRDQGADAALGQARKIVDRGGAPEIYFSEFDHFTVLDGSDPKEFNRSLSLSSRARPFPS